MRSQDDVSSSRPLLGGNQSFEVRSASVCPQAVAFGVAESFEGKSPEGCEAGKTRVCARVRVQSRARVRPFS